MSQTLAGFLNELGLARFEGALVEVTGLDARLEEFFEFVEDGDLEELLEPKYGMKRPQLRKLNSALQRQRNLVARSSTAKECPVEVREGEPDKYVTTEARTIAYLPSTIANGLCLLSSAGLREAGSSSAAEPGRGAWPEFTKHSAAPPVVGSAKQGVATTSDDDESDDSWGTWGAPTPPVPILPALVNAKETAKSDDETDDSWGEWGGDGLTCHHDSERSCKETAGALGTAGIIGSSTGARCSESVQSKKPCEVQGTAAIRTVVKGKGAPKGKTSPKTVAKGKAKSKMHLPADKGKAAPKIEAELKAALKPVPVHTVVRAFLKCMSSNAKNNKASALCMRVYKVLPSAQAVVKKMKLPGICAASGGRLHFDSSTQMLSLSATAKPNAKATPQSYPLLAQVLGKNMKTPGICAASGGRPQFNSGTQILGSSATAKAKAAPQSYPLLAHVLGKNMNHPGICAASGGRLEFDSGTQIVGSSATSKAALASKTHGKENNTGIPKVDVNQSSVIKKQSSPLNMVKSQAFSQEGTVCRLATQPSQVATEKALGVATKRPLPVEDVPQESDEAERRRKRAARFGLAIDFCKSAAVSCREGKPSSSQRQSSEACMSKPQDGCSPHAGASADRKRFLKEQLNGIKQKLSKDMSRHNKMHCKPREDASTDSAGSTSPESSSPSSSASVSSSSDDPDENSEGNTHSMIVGKDQLKHYEVAAGPVSNDFEVVCQKHELEHSLASHPSLQETGRGACLVEQADESVICL